MFLAISDIAGTAEIDVPTDDEDNVPLSLLVPARDQASTSYSPGTPLPKKMKIQQEPKWVKIQSHYNNWQTSDIANERFND